MWALVGAVKNLGDQKALERDASTGRYSNESVAAMVDKHKTGLVYTFLIPAGSPTDIQPMSAAAKRVRRYSQNAVRRSTRAFRASAI